MKKTISPTTRTHEKILNYLKQNEKLVSTNFVAKKLNMDWYSVKASVDFLSKLNVVEVFPSNNKVLFFRLKNSEVIQNATTN